MNPSGRGYAIRIRGSFGPERSAWFSGLTIQPQPDGTTLLSGWITDQPALFGVLWQIRDLGLDLLSLNPSPAEASSAEASSAEE